MKYPWNVHRIAEICSEIIELHTKKDVVDILPSFLSSFLPAILVTKARCRRYHCHFNILAPSRQKNSNNEHSLIYSFVRKKAKEKEKRELQSLQYILLHLSFLPWLWLCFLYILNIYIYIHFFVLQLQLKLQLTGEFRLQTTDVLEDTRKLSLKENGNC